MVEKTSVLSWRGSDKYYNPYIGRGEVLFTGPDGIRDHDTTVLDPNTYVGIGTMSPEGTSDLNYLWRPSKGCTHPLPKSAKVGEIGWGLQFYKDRHHLRSGHQIKHGEFRQATEDRHTHLYQNPWYAGPNDKQPDEAGQDNQVPLCSRSERHMTPVGRYSSRSFRSHTPTPQRFRLSEAQRQTTPRSHSAGPRTRSGTLSSSTSLQS